MPKKQTEWTRAFNEKAYDRLAITVPKGQKAAIQAAADQVGESINGYVNGALLARMGLEDWESTIKSVGYPISVSELAERTGLSCEEVSAVVTELENQRRVYLIGRGYGSAGDFDVSLINRDEYFEAPFASRDDERIFLLLAKGERLTLGTICARLDMSYRNALPAINRLVSQRKVLFPDGVPLQGGSIPEIVFYANPRALRSINQVDTPSDPA